MKAIIPFSVGSPLAALIAATVLLGSSILPASAAQKWSKPNSSTPETLVLLGFEETLESETPASVSFCKVTDLTSADSEKPSAEPEFSQGPVGLGKALKLAPENIL